LFIQTPPPRKRLLSMTPLIDVVFILLLFFMLASSFIEWREIELNVASNTGVSHSDQSPVVIQITQDNFLLRGESVSLDVLTEEVRSELANNTDLQLVVRPQASVPLQRIVTLLDRLRAVGGRNVSLLRAPSDKRK